MPRLAVHDPKGSCTPKRPAPSLCTARVYGGRIPRSLVHTRSRAARQRPMQGGALHHRAFCVNFWIESLPGSELDRALHIARVHRVPLIVAKVDRLARSKGFLERILESGVDVRFCDLPKIE